MVQDTSRKITLKFGQPTDANRNNVTIVENVPLVNGGVEPVDYLIKSVTPSADKMSAVVEVFYKFNHNGNYTVSLNGKEEDFTASVGEPKTMTLYADNADAGLGVKVGVITGIKYKLFDAKKVDVTEEYADSNNLAKSVNYTVTYSDGYTLEEDSIYFSELGMKATVVAEYHPNTSFVAGEEQGIITSDPTDFYATADNAVSIKGIDSWKINENGQKYVVLKDKTDPGFVPNTLQVTLAFTDGTKQTFNRYDESIYDGKGNYLGYINFTSLQGDILDVYEVDSAADQEGNNVAVFGRQVDTAKVMVSYVHYVGSDFVETPIGAINVEVKDKSRMSSVDYNVKNLVVSAAPGDTNGENTKAVEDMEIALVIKDQYGQAYPHYVITDWTWTNPIAQRATVAETVADVASTANREDLLMSHDVAVTIAADQENITIHNRQLEALLWDLNNDLKADGTQPASQASFGYRVTVKDTLTGKKLVAAFSINARGHIGDMDHKDEKGHSFDFNNAVTATALNATGNNIVRYEDPTWGYGDSVWNSAKTISYSLYEICNSAKYDEVEFDLLPDTIPATATLAVSDGYYLKVFRNGKDVTNQAVIDGLLDHDNNDPLGATATYTLTDLGTSDYNAPGQIVIYDNDHETIGTGTYQFVFYSVVSSKVTRVNTKTVSAKLDTDKYTLKSRDSVYASAATAKELLKCFTILDRNDVAYKNWTIVDNGDLTGWVDFGDRTRAFEVVRNYDMEATRAGESVFVEKIVFWEALNNTTEESATEWAEYVVNVNKFVEIVQPTY